MFDRSGLRIGVQSARFLRSRGVPWRVLVEKSEGAHCVDIVTSEPGHETHRTLELHHAPSFNMAERPETIISATDRILRDLGRTQITSDEPRLSESERRVLELHDQIKDTQLRRAVVDAGPLVPRGKLSCSFTRYMLTKSRTRPGERASLERD